MKILRKTRLRRFEEDGYLVVEEVLDPARDFDPIWAEYGHVLDEIVESLYAEGVIHSTYPGLGFAERLIRIYADSGRDFHQYFDISLPQTGLRHDTPIHVGPAVFNLLTNRCLLDLIEDILGPEIYVNPVQHIRIKPPARALGKHTGYNALVAKTPWHQDNGVVLPEADGSHILTVWLPITESTIENGCLQVVPRSHRGDLLTHCPAGALGVSIPETLLPKEHAVSLPMRPGSVLVMYQRTIHSSLENITDNDVRVSFDLRYQPIGEPTGRPIFPGFIARSSVHPDSVLRDPVAWAQSWQEARARLAERENPTFNRWRADAPACA
jgi:phytanoyl-CoA hydroxylase